MIRVGVIGAGKMGLSHLAILGAHPDVQIVGVCDSIGYLLDVLERYTGMHKFTDAISLFDEHPDAVLIATPSASHVALVGDALERGIHVFCEKPLTLSGDESTALADVAATVGAVTQVGYHNRFVGTFREVRRLLDLDAIGHVSHVLAEAYGPVVLRQKGDTWRSRKTAGGGALYDYAAHPLDLLCWYLGEPEACDRRGARPRLLGRDRRRGLRHLELCRRRECPALRELVGRVVSQDDHEGDALGRRAARSSPTGRSARSTCAIPPTCQTATGSGGTAATPPRSPHRSGTTCGARSTAPRSTISCDRWRRRRTAAAPRNPSTTSRARPPPIARSSGSLTSPRTASTCFTSSRAHHDRTTARHGTKEIAMTLDRLLLWGTTSSSASITCPRRTRARSALRFQDTSAIIGVIDDAVEAGVHLHVHHA